MAAGSAAPLSVKAGVSAERDRGRLDRKKSKLPQKTCDTWLPLNLQYAAEPVASATACAPPKAASNSWHSFVVLLSAHIGQSCLAKQPARACAVFPQKHSVA